MNIPFLDEAGFNGMVKEIKLAIAAAFKKVSDELEVVSKKIGDLSKLQTTNKSDIVSAVNEINLKSDSGGGGFEPILLWKNASHSASEHASQNIDLKSIIGDKKINFLLIVLKISSGVSNMVTLIVPALGMVDGSLNIPGTIGIAGRANVVMGNAAYYRDYTWYPDTKLLNVGNCTKFNTYGSAAPSTATSNGNLVTMFVYGF